MGGLPDDLVVGLDGATLTVQGVPRVAGLFGQSVWIEDSDGATVAEPIELQILDDPTLDAPRVLLGVVGGGMVSADQTDYLDRSGHADGGLDVGDLRAFVNRED